MARGVEVGGGFDDGFGGDGFGAVVFRKEGLNGSDEVFGSVCWDFVAVNLEFKALAEELRGAFVANGFNDWSFVGERGVA